MEITGSIVLKRINVGSKSEHEAICILTNENKYIKLRKPGGNPFRDPSLEGFVGKNVTIKGDFFKSVADDNPIATKIFMCNEIKEN